MSAVSPAALLTAALIVCAAAWVGWSARLAWWLVYRPADCLPDARANRAVCAAYLAAGAWALAAAYDYRAEPGWNWGGLVFIVLVSAGVALAALVVVLINGALDRQEQARQTVEEPPWPR